MNTSVENLDLSRFVFSRRDTRMYLAISDEKRENGDRIYISVTREDAKGVRNDLITASPVYNGEKVDFTYAATPWKLTIKTEYGDLEMCYDTLDEVLQVRSDNGIGIAFYITFYAHELFCDRVDGSVEAGFTTMGELLFDVTEGKQSNDSVWQGARMFSTPTTVLWEPDGKALKGYIHWSHEFVEKQPVNDFDGCVEANRKDYECWLSKLPEVPEKYAELKRIAGYVSWTSHQLPLVRLKEPMMYMMRTGVMQRGTTWQQSEQAMSLWKDQKLALSLIYSFFSLQDEYGMLPDSANDRDVVYFTTKPPLQGFALTWILDHTGDENADRELCEKIYEPLCRWVSWWQTYRKSSIDGLSCYMHGDESGFDDSSVFAEGVPVISPDLQAYLALCMEACGRLAKILGMAEKAEKHFRESEEMIRRLTDKLWNGNKFVCIVEKEGKILNAQSLCCYIPIILGKRLPGEIVDIMYKDLADPNKFRADKGFRTESLDSPLFDDTIPGPFALGKRMAVSQLIITVGLMYAGKTELALENAENWCDMLLEQGCPITELQETEGRANIVPDERPVYNPFTVFPGKFSSWGTPVFLVLGEILKENGREG